MPDELYLLRLWVISLFAFLVLGDASLLFLDMNCLSSLYGVDVGHLVQFVRQFKMSLGPLIEEGFEGEFNRHKGHSAAVRSRTDLLKETECLLGLALPRLWRRCHLDTLSLSSTFELHPFVTFCSTLVLPS